MKQEILLLLSIFSILFFASFASESISESLPKKENFDTRITSQKEIVVRSKKRKTDFKERLALKLVKKKATRKQNISTNNKRSPLERIIFVGSFVLFSLGGLVSGIIYMALGETLLGVLLLLGGLIVIPAIFFLFFVAFIMPDRATDFK